jgi:diaminohydroxyphosphoribosylaminopyrimidine deaminase/5-amino-6-(5-phosphoribosylamino)uracil reductase
VDTAVIGVREDEHALYMGQALALASRALGRTSPNPAVGAVLVRDGEVVGRGHTLPPGGPHAEVVALREAGARARGATLYVSLEPCSHYGRTPPCTDALIAAGVREVYAAVRDPYPEVDGRGIGLLRAAGIEVRVGLCEAEARQLNEGFFKRTRTGLPFVTAKYAMTLDGRIATRTGHSRWITGPDARRQVHKLRDRSDAILVGSGTVLVDDPELTTRLPTEEAGWGGPHHPLRVVLDGSGRAPLDARLFDPELPGRTLVACTEATSDGRRTELRARGVETLVVEGEGARVSPRSLLKALGARGCNTVLVEGGSETLWGFFSEGLVDRVQAYVAPKLVGGREAPGPIGGAGLDEMSGAWTLRDLKVQRYGDDLLVDGYVARGAEEG